MPHCDYYVFVIMLNIILVIWLLTYDIVKFKSKIKI